MTEKWRVFAAAVCGLVVICLSGCMMVDLSSLMTGELKEITLTKSKGWGVSDKILLLDISGVIVGKSDGGLLSDSGCTPDYVKAALNKAVKDPNIKAIVLRIDSPGGEVSAIDNISHEIKQIKNKTKLPVYSMIMGLGCSGGYHAACAGDRIYAQPSATVGSIGVILSIPKIAKLADKIGLEMVIVKSGNMKDIGNMFRDLTPEESEVLQLMITEHYHQFMDWIIDSRPALKSRDQLKPIADGRIYTSAQALEHKLIDRIGYLDDAIADIKTAAKLNKYMLVTYSYRSSEDANIYSPVSQRGPAQFNMVNIPLPIRMPSAKPGFYYLWQP
ncbi:signal peptide peptidase SppA [Verrucomicrobiota bacterium]